MNDSKRRSREGQVLPLFALFLVVLLGFAALAIDVSGALSARRFYRSVADGAALAGAQDLQDIGSRVVSIADKKNARHDAMAHLVAALGITGTLPPECATGLASPDNDVPDTCVLPGTRFHVSIKTPVGACQDCDVTRSLQVSLRNAEYGLTFARVLGQSTWNVGVTSVAGLSFGKAYAIQTLRPPKKNGSTFVVNDIALNGGSVVTVIAGDVGTNANMVYTNTGSVMKIDPDYVMYYFDPWNVPQWTGQPMPPARTVTKLTTLIPDPNYNNFGTADGYPSMVGAPTFTDSTGPATRANPTTSPLNWCQLELNKVSLTSYAFLVGFDPAKIWCYRPGIYSGTNAQIQVKNGEVALLAPGTYYLQQGLNISGNPAYVIGGYEPGQPGVALVFDETGPGNCSQCVFNGTTAAAIALNAGSKFPPGLSGVAATAARDWSNNLIQTSGPSSPTPPIPITLLVKKDPSCFVPTSPPFQEPVGCNAGKDKTINLAGGGSLALEGVQYAPTDNVEIHGGSSGNGTIGQIIAWTLFYSGGTQINQEGPPGQGPGTLRLDAACTAPGTPCSP